MAEHTEVTDRIVYPMLRRAASSEDDTVSQAHRSALEALDISEHVRHQGDSADLDRLASNVRHVLAANELVVYPLLNVCLNVDERTHLADSIDEVLVGGRQQGEHRVRLSRPVTGHTTRHG